MAIGRLLVDEKRPAIKLGSHRKFPMRLYHFTSQEYGLEALRKQRLKIARIDELNDPFEFLGWNLRDREVRANLQAWKKQRNAEIGIICLSEKWRHPLLWGHYADKHKGIAIGFDVPDNGTYLKVKYRGQRVQPPQWHMLNDADLEGLLLTKFTAWKYEMEYRRFCRLDDSFQDGDLYFEPFSDTLRPAKVIVGYRSKVTRTELQTALGSDLLHVIRFKARPAYGKFSVVRNQNEKLWT